MHCSPTFRPHPPPDDAVPHDKASIVILIAALRETRVVASINSALKWADNPDRVFIGVVQQNQGDDEDALEGYCKESGHELKRLPEFNDSPVRRKDGEHEWGQSRYTGDSFAACKRAKQIRVFRMEASEASGPVFARAQQKRLLGTEKSGGEEDFCLQVDAHTVFTKGWDTYLLKEWGETKNEYAILTTYPTGANELPADGGMPNINNHWEMPHLCDAEIQGPGLVRNAQAGAAANLVVPALCKLWAAGLSFSRCHAERLVPADPTLKHIFMGEEFARGARLWTHGYDFYTMARPAIGTWYGADKGNAEGWAHDTDEAQKAHDRIATLLQAKGSDQSSEALAAMKGYELGKRRSFKDYIALTGVDTIAGKYTHTHCMIDRWQPWLDDAPKPIEAMPKKSSGISSLDQKQRLQKAVARAKAETRPAPNAKPEPPNTATAVNAKAEVKFGRDEHQHYADGWTLLVVGSVVAVLLAKVLRRVCRKGLAGGAKEG